LPFSYYLDQNLTNNKQCIIKTANFLQVKLAHALKTTMDLRRKLAGIRNTKYKKKIDNCRCCNT